MQLKVAKYTILNFSCIFPFAKSPHIRMDSMVALSYLIKMKGTQNKSLALLSKEIWNYVIAKEITRIQFSGSWIQRYFRYIQAMGNTRCWNICILSFTRGSILHDNRCFSKFMDSNERVSISSLFISGSCAQQSTDISDNVNINYTTFANSVVVSTTDTNVCGKIASAKSKQSIDRFKWWETPSNKKWSLQLLAWTISEKSYLEKEL